RDELGQYQAIWLTPGPCAQPTQPDEITVISQLASLCQAALFTMVGMAGQDRHRPVNLLHQHDSDKLMRPSCRSECEGHIGIIQEPCRKTVGSPNHEAHDVTAAIAPTANSPSKVVARGILTLAIQDSLDGIVGNGAEQRDCFFRHAALRFAGATLPNFDDVGSA